MQTNRMTNYYANQLTVLSALACCTVPKTKRRKQI